MKMITASENYQSQKLPWIFLRLVYAFYAITQLISNFTYCLLHNSEISMCNVMKVNILASMEKNESLTTFHWEGISSQCISDTP